MYPITNWSSSVYYEFPSTSHIHKSMLLRGVKLPPPALDRTDIEMTKSKAQRSGRGYGGVPLGRNNYNHGGRRDPINYGPGRDDTRQGRGGYAPPSRRNNHQGPPYGAPPPNWQPPPPGYPGFGVGMPPPPPPARVHGGDQYGNNYGQDYGQGYGNHYRGPPPPPRGNYGGQQYHRQPAGRGRQDYRPHGGDRGGYRGSRGYR